MKKFYVSLFIIICFSLFVYYTGSTQRRIEPGTFAVLQTKTNGLIEKPLISGEKNWNWQFLLPTNTKLTSFTIEPLTTTQTVSGQLPSGNFYGSQISQNYTFDYSFTFNIALTISPDAVVRLIKLNQITDNNSLKNYLETASKTLSSLATSYVLEKLKANNSFTVESLRKDEILKNVSLYKDFPDVEVYSLSIVQSSIPDLSLFSKVQNGTFITNDIQSKTQSEAENINQIQKDNDDEKTNSN